MINIDVVISEVQTISGVDALLLTPLRIPFQGEVHGTVLNAMAQLCLIREIRSHCENSRQSRDRECGMITTKSRCSRTTPR
jgi:hypothetical protein